MFFWTKSIYFENEKKKLVMRCSKVMRARTRNKLIFLPRLMDTLSGEKVLLITTGLAQLIFRFEFRQTLGQTSYNRSL